jgi:hypothetical protein
VEQRRVESNVHDRCWKNHFVGVQQRRLRPGERRSDQRHSAADVSGVQSLFSDGLSISGSTD